MIFLVAMTTASIFFNLKYFLDNTLLFSLSAIMFVLAVWLIFEAAVVSRKASGDG